MTEGCKESNTGRKSGRLAGEEVPLREWGNDPDKKESPPTTPSGEDTDTPDVPMEEETAEQPPFAGGEAEPEPLATAEEELGESPAASNEEITQDVDMGGETPEEGGLQETEVQLPLEKSEDELRDERCMYLREAIKAEEEQIAQAARKVTEYKKELLMEEVARRYRRGRVEMGLPRSATSAAQATQTAQATQVAGVRAPSRFVSPKRPRTADAKEALEGLLCPKKAPVKTAAVKLPRAPYGETRRKLEDLGARRGDIAHLNFHGGKFWFTGDGRGIAKILDILKKAEVEAEEHIVLPDEWRKELRERLKDEASRRGRNT